MTFWQIRLEIFNYISNYRYVIAAPKGIVTYRFDIWRNGHAGQATATIKGTSLYRSDTRRNGYTGQATATRVSIIS